MQADLRAELKDLAELQKQLAVKQQEGHAELLKEFRSLIIREDYSTRPPQKANSFRFARSPSSFSDDGTSPSWATDALPWPQKVEPMMKSMHQSQRLDARIVQHKMLAEGVQETLDKSCLQTCQDTSCVSPAKLPSALDAEAAHHNGVCPNSKVTSLLTCNVPTTQD